MAKAKANVVKDENGGYRVMLYSHGKRSYCEKKVMATGKFRYGLSLDAIHDAMRALRAGEDFIIGDDEFGGIRVYMIVGSDGKLKVCASTYGDFRNCMADAKWTVSKKAKIDYDEARNRDKTGKRAYTLGRLAVQNVTPDMTITFMCEKCGHPNTVRVGKKLV